MTDQITAPQPYSTVAETYDRLGELVFAGWGEKPHHEKADFLSRLWSDGAPPVDSVLELACGTGLMLGELVERGHRVVGLDRSEAMLARARARLGADVPLVCAALPDIPVDQRFDAVISPGSSLNYLTETELAATFRSVAAKLRPGGSFVFDVLSPSTMGDHGGGNVLAGDFGDTAFILAFANSADGARSDVTWTQFVRTAPEADAPYLKSVERHHLHRATPETIRASADACGLAEQGVYDNYAFRPLDEATSVQTWVFRLPTP
ncbi:class I SAM-dependent DNA methyltransferase [Streptomyces sp. NBC_01429]|uniref:class I SAM-dependent DNA methyltransferase n=1 Tax=Streptomyces sp. NBC_01429 TaxID=2903862 RepID=UPI002E2A4E7C|nr:class I SAM-dependent methyltransferase [Streptomyces sp. NBC_01429]